MKRLFSIFAVVLLVIVFWFSLIKQATTKKRQPTTFNTNTEQSISEQQTTNSGFVLFTKKNTYNAIHPIRVTISRTEALNATTATNLAQWKAAVKGLKYTATYGDLETWVMDGIDSKQSVAFKLGDTNHVVQYDANFISIDAKKQNGEILSVDLHGLKMNIVELKEMGSKLHELTGKDPGQFFEWCDKVGNTWLDAPLYSAGNATTPDGRTVYAFDVNRTYDDTRPWHISFLITYH